jgi:hypothetical protein
MKLTLFVDLYGGWALIESFLVKNGSSLDDVENFNFFPCKICILVLICYSDSVEIRSFNSII